MTDKVEMNCAKINSLVEMIKKAENDSQKCAALLVVAKMVKANELSANQRKRIFLAIGDDFPLRLLTNNENTESKNFLINLGLSLVSSFVSEVDVESSKLHKAIPVIIKLLSEKSNLAAEDQIVLTDCFQFLSAMATTKRGCNIILKHFGIQPLVNQFSSMKLDENCETMFWNILFNLINVDQENVWEGNLMGMSRLLEYVSESIRNDQSSKKFAQLQQLYLLLMKLPKHHSEVYFQQCWIDNLTESLYDIFRSRINHSQRDPALKLSSCLTEIYGLKWTLHHNETKSKDKQLLVLLIQLSCVEIKMIIYEWSKHNPIMLQEKQDSHETSLLLSCFIIFESVCAEIAIFDSTEDSVEVLSFKDIEEIQTTLSDTAKVITENILAPLMEEDKIDDIKLCCLRAVGSWLNLELYATSEIGLSLAGTFLSTFKSCLKHEPVDAIRSATPAILHYAENKNSLNKILNLDLAHVFCDLITNLELATDTKTLAAQCLMALCLATDNPSWFVDILPKLMENAIKNDVADMVTWFYISTLVLLLWNKQTQATHNMEHSKRFFKNLTNIFYQMHTTDGSHIGVNKRYGEIWQDIEELWSITMKEYIRAVQNCGDFATILLESRLPQKVRTLVVSSSENEVVECYGLLDACIEMLEQC